MKKSNLIALIAVIVAFIILAAAVCYPLIMLFGGTIIGMSIGTNAEIEIDSYRLCQDADGNDIILIKYLLKNTGDEPTALYYEGDFYVYQNGISLTENNDEEELPKECDYNSEDKYRNIKGGVNYYAEIAYILESPDTAVEVEVHDYGFFNKKKEKTFVIS